ncbi:MULTISPECIES: hypothetical protein [Streptomyces]|uniref:hypothetical protein n=1 Tax=Streptomyces cyaneofuscatus TaxID=66883 RepID=UPI003688688B
MVARNIEVEKETAITTAATQQQPENELKQYALQLQITRTNEFNYANYRRSKRRDCGIAETYCFRRK